MPELEPQITPETRERLRPGEVLLFPQPGYLMNFVNFAGGLAIYRRYINPLDPYPSDITVLAHKPQIQEHIRKSLHGYIEFKEQEQKVMPEYNGLIQGLLMAVGTDKICFTNNSSYCDDSLTPDLDDKAAAYNQQVSYIQSITFPTTEVFTGFPRDMFAQFGKQMFVNPKAFPLFRETPQYKRSPLGEGGMSVMAKNAVIFSEKLQEDRNAVRDVRALEQRGYKVAFIPPVIVEKQPADRREIGTDHIDGHSALIVGKDKQLHFLFALSYANQNARTFRALFSAAKKIGAKPHAIQDSDMTHLDLNFIQLPDGSVVYPVTGKVDSEEYYVSGLDRALRDLVGEENIIYVPPLVHIPRLTKAGLRCMTNTAPLSFLHYLARNAA